MSDYISDIENCVKLINSVHGNSNYAPSESFFNQSNANLLEADTRVGYKDECLRGYIGARKYNTESECCDPGCIRLHRIKLIERFDSSDIAELERLSSNLIQLLHKAGHNAAKVKSACGQSHRHYHSHEPISQRQYCPPNFQMQQVPNEQLFVTLGGRDVTSGGRDVTLGRRDVTFGGRDITPGGKDVTLDGRDTMSGGRDVTLVGRDVTLVGRDVPLGGRDATPGGRDVTSGGRHVTSGRRDVTSGGRDVTLGGREVTLVGRDVTLGRRDVTLGGRDVNFGDRDVTLGGRDEEQNVQEHTEEIAPIQINSMNERRTSTSTMPDDGISVGSPLAADNSSTITGFSDKSLNSSAEESENDRQKKMKHNKMEQKRRSIINNKISELGSLLPENVKRSCRQKKGKILTESIDYIKSLKNDQCQVQKLQDKVVDTDRELRTLINRVETLETRFSTQSSFSGRCEPQLRDESGFLQQNERRRNVHEHHPTTSRASVASILPLYDVYDTLSTPYSVDSGISVPSSSGMDIDDMNCYL